MKLIVHTAKQTAELRVDNRWVRSFSISSAKNGLGCVEGSFCTPTGLLRVAQKFGAGLEAGSVLRSRIPTGEIWSRQSDNSLANSDDDLILSRVLWLEGIEPANQNTLERYIYLHGTNSEHLLGQAVSHGCIRFSNADIIELFELLPIGAEVEIG